MPRERRSPADLVATSVAKVAARIASVSQASKVMSHFLSSDHVLPRDCRDSVTEMTSASSYTVFPHLLSLLKDGKGFKKILFLINARNRDFSQFCPSTIQCTMRL